MSIPSYLGKGFLIPENFPKDVMKRTIGTALVEFTSEDFLDKGKSGGTIFQNAVGQILFLLLRTNDLFLEYYHSSPGTGTRVAKLDLNELEYSSKFKMAFFWSPTEIKINLSAVVEPRQAVISATGKKSETELRVDNLGNIYIVGSPGVTTHDFKVYHGDKLVLDNSAIQHWQETIRALEILDSAIADKNPLEFETVNVNVSLTVLVTGLENYMKTRFCELYDEGVQPDLEEFVKVCYSKTKIDEGILADFIAEAQQIGIPLFKHVLQKTRINFQNYETVKRLFKKVYHVDLSFAGTNSKLIDNVKRTIQYRHRIVHVSPLLMLLNQKMSQEAVQSTYVVKQELVNSMKAFIALFHEQTLKAR